MELDEELLEEFDEELKELDEELEGALAEEIEAPLDGTAFGPVLSELKKEVSPTTG